MSDPVSVSILDREFLIACTAEERPGLIAAAAYLDGKMREVRNAIRAPGLDRIAVLAALNITHELINLKQQGATDASDVAQHVQALKHKLEGVLSASVK
ncbi:cell division protein ZapA [Tahibacter amnicola]|uniref:Cell division protein ZapA n=1 Tax=Tahibacter amnicola TaxID=2976241 RepID=A0ABY6BGK8_9GAMM|nr:cell division protein ZapA [Tahibacter amnicola]UXI69168.1 cell division protein ZapA [Tahibacter amnicola]